MKFHKEGNFLIGATALFILLVLLVVYYGFGGFTTWFVVSAVVCFVLLILVLQFFRNPDRTLTNPEADAIYAPADGKVVVIEEVVEEEYFKEKRLMISVFMSPLNVHVNRNPVNGEVVYAKYHPGKYLAAWNPKSSTENERTTIVYDTGKYQMLMRQVAGALARRIIYYVKPTDKVIQGDDMGFIKLGSRVDIYLPLNAKVEVELGQKSIGNRTILARI